MYRNSVSSTSLASTSARHPATRFLLLPTVCSPHWEHTTSNWRMTPRCQVLSANSLLLTFVYLLALTVSRAHSASSRSIARASPKGSSQPHAVTLRVIGSWQPRARRWVARCTAFCLSDLCTARPTMASRGTNPKDIGKFTIKLVCDYAASTILHVSSPAIFSLALFSLALYLSLSACSRGA